ncbi:hypothetical protein BKA70DRAFT_674100 [Coprinopsis sp. MPI-PUGE-AT-0042]|nr:hypothetical protein BKA70DRAFT_674100 [Coprinopsis sp. MPI-PUGE-AT-0042]
MLSNAMLFTLTFFNPLLHLVHILPTTVSFVNIPAIINWSVADLVKFEGGNIRVGLKARQELPVIICHVDQVRVDVLVLVLVLVLLLSILSIPGAKCVDRIPHHPLVVLPHLNPRPFILRVWIDLVEVVKRSMKSLLDVAVLFVLFILSNVRIWAVARKDAKDRLVTCPSFPAGAPSISESKTCQLPLHHRLEELELPDLHHQGQCTGSET